MPPTFFSDIYSDHVSPGLLIFVLSVLCFDNYTIAQVIVEQEMERDGSLWNGDDGMAGTERWNMGTARFTFY